jgi:uncharacterized C2H2 Zn-finger protein
MLSNHIKKDHLCERNLNCELCTFSCFDNGELQVHLVKQHGEKLFECDVCKKCYGSHKTLSQHLSVHSKEKLNCGLCSETFTQSKSYKNHMKMHRGM